MPDTLSDDTADRFASTTLGHVTREYPNYLTHALAGPGDPTLEQLAICQSEHLADDLADLEADLVVRGASGQRAHPLDIL